MVRSNNIKATWEARRISERLGLKGIPKIPSLCLCKCKEITWNGNEYIKGHHNKTIENRKINSISQTKYCFYDEYGNKLIYPPIPTLCYCGCGTIIFGGSNYVRGHQRRGSDGLKGNLNPSKRPEVKNKIKVGNTDTYLLDLKGNKLIYPPIFDLCHCNCGEIVWGGNKFISGHNSYIDGRSFFPYCEKWTSTLREAVRQRDNHTCQLCGVKQTELIGFIKNLSVHHIHYKKEDCYSDLITLCTGCNSKVNYNRKYYESIFMNKLNERNLLFWTRSIAK